VLIVLLTGKDILLFASCLKPKKPDYLGELEWNLFLVAVTSHPYRYVFCF
jgi:hypothetical protein